MNQEQISEFKKQVREFHKVIAPITEYWEQPHLITLSVLVQNLGFDSSDCHGYSIAKDNEKIRELLNIIKVICNYKNSHFENWIFSEIDIIHTGTIYAIED